MGRSTKQNELKRELEACVRRAGILQLDIVKKAAAVKPARHTMAAKAAMANATPNYFSAEAMGFILAALFFNTLTAPVVKMTQNAEGGYDYNKW